MRSGTFRSRTIGTIVALTALLGSMLATAPGAGAAVGPTVPACQVKNTTTAVIYKSNDGQALTDALDQAADGVTIAVKGKCVGNFTITQEFLTLKGISGLGVPTIDGGNGIGSVLTVNPDAIGRVTSLTITGGTGTPAVECGGCALGGGINNYGQLILKGNTNVTSNSAFIGGGVFNWGLFAMHGNARVQVNTATLVGGGLASCGPIIGVIDGVNVLNNTPDNVDTSC